ARVAKQLGFTKSADSLFVSAEQAQRIPRDELLVIATGTQGEPPAALSRLARGQHPNLRLEAGDRVILSSRIIPGSENGVFDMINALERRGVRVIHRRTDGGVHVSGHAYRGEQQTMLEAVRPRSFLPVHGTFYHLSRHAELARSLGVGDVQVFENGTVIGLGERGLASCGRVRTGRIHRQRGIAVADELLRERELMGELGIVIASIPVGGDDDAVGYPTVILRGYTDGSPVDELRDEAERYLHHALSREVRPQDGFAEIEDCGRRALRRFFRTRKPRAPLVIATAVEH